MSLAFSQNNLIEAEKLAQKTICNWEENPDRIKENPSSYITTLNNLVGIYLQQKKYELVEKLLLKIRAVPEQYQLRGNSPLTSRSILHTYNVQMEIYRDTQQIDRGCSLIEETELHFQKIRHQGPKDTLLLLYYQSSHILYLAGKKAEALQYLNKIINDQWDEQRLDIQAYAHLLFLLIHFELDHINLLRYAIESSRRFLKKRQILKNFETELLKLFSKLTSKPKGEHKKLFIETRERIFNNLSIKEKENRQCTFFLNCLYMAGEQNRITLQTNCKIINNF